MVDLQWYSLKYSVAVGIRHSRYTIVGIKN
jgi:hypothetical protein